MGLLHDTHFWVLAATVIFALVAFRMGKKPLLAMLDARTTRIRQDMEEAARLKKEAQEMLVEAQKKNRDAVQTAQKIIDDAKDAAARMQKDASLKLEDGLKRREAQLLDRIARAESAAVQELRQKAADLAVHAAEELLRDALPKRGAQLVDDAIAHLPGRVA